jgi:hypothetical protein
MLRRGALTLSGAPESASLLNVNFPGFFPTSYLNQALYLQVRPEPIQVEHRKFSHYPQILDEAEARIEAFH